MKAALHAGIALTAVAVLALANGRAGAQSFELPDLLALEAPAGTAELPLSDPAVSQLLVEGVAAGSASLRLTSEDPANVLRIGPNRVTWTAEDPGGTVVARRTDFVYLLPHGQTPVAVARGPVENDPGYATAGNHGAHVVRDGRGGIHVAWRDKKPGVMYRYGIQNPDTGVVTWQGPVIDISDGTAVERCFVALAASAGAVHAAWRGTGNEVHYRRLRVDAAGTEWGAIEKTGAIGNSHDNGPDIAVFGDDEIHVLSRAMQYAFSVDGGDNWNVEDLRPELPDGMRDFKYPALTVDSRGHVHMLVTTRMDDYFWPLWYLHFDRPSRRRPGDLLEAHYPFAAMTEWQVPGEGGRRLYLDWVDIEADAADGLHIGWHGTFYSGAYAEDDAFYSTRPADGDGDPNAWRRPVALTRHDPGTLFLSFTPSLATDAASDTAFTVFMTKALGQAPLESYNDVDSALRVLRGGDFIDDALRGGGRYVPLSNAATWPMATWWPTVAPRLYRHPNGRVWLDVLQSMLHKASSDDFAIIVHQRFDATDIVGADTAQAQAEAPPNSVAP